MRDKLLQLDNGIALHQLCSASDALKIGENSKVLNMSEIFPLIDAGVLHKRQLTGIWGQFIAFEKPGKRIKSVIERKFSNNSVWTFSVPEAFRNLRDVAFFARLSDVLVVEEQVNGKAFVYLEVAANDLKIWHDFPTVQFELIGKDNVFAEGFEFLAVCNSDHFVGLAACDLFAKERQALLGHEPSFPFGVVVETKF